MSFSRTPFDHLVTGWLGRGAMRIVSPGGNRGLSILIYHRVLAQRDPLFPAEVDRTDFDLQVSLLKTFFNIMPLIDAVRHLRDGTLPARAACITFDDGYADNAAVALPVLQHHGVSATFFVATGFLNGGRMWNDTLIELVRNAPDPFIDVSCIGMGILPIGSIAQRRFAIKTLINELKYLPINVRADHVERLVESVKGPLPRDLMMSTAQVQELHRAGMGIGGHTVNHPILARIPLATARREITEGKLALEEMIGEPIRLFAYPNGKPGEDFTADHVQIAKQLNFEGAVSTSWGTSPTADLYQLPRFTPWDRTRLRFLFRLGANLRNRAAVV